MRAIDDLRFEIQRLLKKSEVAPTQLKKWALIESCRVLVRAAIKDGVDITPILELIDEIDRRWKDAH